MNLLVSTVGVDSGLLWEQNLNADILILDGHNHTAGNGIQIPPAGLNINAPLPFNNQQATNVQAVVFTPQISPSATSPAVGAIYMSGVDLYFNDGTGSDSPIQITSGGAVNASSSGLASGTATAAFNTGVLVVNAASLTPANIQCGSILLGNNVASSKYLTLQPPSSMAASYPLTLPSTPGTQSIMTLDTGGNMATPVAYPIPQAGLASGSVGTSQIIALNVTTGTIAANAVTFAKLAALNITTNTISTANPTTTAFVWTALTNNSISLTAGTWRLTGFIFWGGSNQSNELTVGWFGANGANSASTPATISGSPTVLTGQIGVVQSLYASGANTNFATIHAPATIITVTTTTTVYLCAAQTATGTGVTISGTLSAEQLR